MDLSIFLILVQDGITSGAIYALLALSLVLVFTVTRVIFIPQGEFVAYGALTMATLEMGEFPTTAWLLLALGILAAVAGLLTERRLMTMRRLALLIAETILLPLVILIATSWLAPRKPGLLVEMLLALAIVTPMGPYVYRIAFRPLAEASTLVLLIAAVGVHLAMTGLGLVFFGAEGSRTASFSDVSMTLGPVLMSGQSLWVIGASAALVAALYLVFDLTLIGKALRATAVNRLGARLVGIEPALCGRIAFGIAAFIGALSGLLIGPLTTVYYDSGFLIGLKGFVAAIIAGLVSYPGAALAAILIGVVESLASFSASAFKEVIVFMVIIPVLLWRSLRHAGIEEEE
ncbi:amino acid/amide ABC transporter membrane protein 1, HAAT family [Rhizobiales bacterium GAS188]|nr:amino acid/amide ABC transporter membrane protein 1, HAAT family [Rhizobiales bacterium GAS188]